MYLSDKKRIVIKIGTSTLTHSTGLLNIRRVEHLVKNIADIRNSGREIIIVTSGAVGVGCGKLGLKEKPSDTPTKQAMAAIGQCELMYIYDRLFSEYNQTVAQLLITKTVVNNEKLRFNCKNTLTRLLDLNALPIINENDTVAVDELEFGDNDTLSAIVSEIVEADLLLILSDIDGLYDCDPKSNPDAKLIEVVDEINDEIIGLAKGAGSKLGTGGMITKIHAAQIANEAGIDMVIINGSNPDLLYDIFSNKQVGTLFKSNKTEG